MPSCRSSSLSLLALVMVAGTRAASFRPDISNEIVAQLSNELREYPEAPEKRGLMTCRRSAVCGLVQANAWGINAEKFCDCPGRQSCPLLWDPEDGRSVTHGSNQYKYCRQAPALSVCSPGQQAMTDELVSYRDERLSMAHHEFIHCRCPAGHQLKQIDTQWSETDDSDVMVTTKACTKMPQCSPGQHCKFVTQSSDKASEVTTLVQVNCACAPSQTCPTRTEHKIETQAFGHGSLHSILCR
ncbi:hypothetical protein FJT64_011732 [Amphibalanus amphitrite]|uniref:Uncharacterized protein n=1 Tax=Amphibalanus amphitrite TaxID=1232801 RepID=A0A6A4V8F4_AMPAM|nr:U-scoloptoxin(11)-Sm5a-like [Amphibalanus amphitrite]KAF0290015.1 hypothetical protein FJT64_011732 [Amphibalanus amphitrite]